MKRIAVIIGLLAVFSLVPNLIWLVHSTARITNTGEDALNAVIVYVDNQETNLGELPPGRSRFIFLPKLGDATYKVSYVRGPSAESVCQEYVEGSMYHVETLLSGTKGSRCDVTLPLFSDLFLLKML